MTLIFRPTYEERASLPLGKTFEIILSGVVRDSRVQVRTLLKFECNPFLVLYAKVSACRLRFKHTSFCHTQAVAVQLPEELMDKFVGAAPHITLSFAQGSTAKQAGMASLYFGACTAFLVYLQA